ncbi:hypothetical protein fugu_000002 [Takifugu bimaculatus]|uniref:C3H1-type domain-containing protein n=1 Tax=Takifugu bimaculatus TaxID=433685 RepID=A0A4Z2CFE0_9TELE|nr:hypothetical protein fugu_000002 [Takifugu bimaculatus]
MALNISSVRDTKWLTLEVCRQFQRGNCSRSNEECKFAHPPKSCQVENGRVIACFDSLKGRCSRENCKYLHPPSHLKTQLEINGRNNLIQQKTAAAVLAQQVQMMLPGHSLQPVGLGTNTGLCYGSYVTPLGHGMNLVQTDSLPSTQVLVPGSPPRCSSELLFFFYFYLLFFFLFLLAKAAATRQTRGVPGVSAGKLCKR